MYKKLQTALIISTYNWPEALNKVLSSVLNQRVLPDEILIADDGSDGRTAKLIDSFKNKFPIPLKHFWHSDDGFRKTIVMNVAIASCTSDYIIQIDGDIILHPDFIKDHIEEAEKGFYIKGSRVLLSKEKTKELLGAEDLVAITPYTAGITNRINACHSRLFSRFFIKKRKRSHDLRGCNCAYWRGDFITVNGYNNDLSGWGHEDIEIAARFINLGLLQKSIKLKAVCYHLDHPFNTRTNEEGNFKKYEEVVEKRIVKCLNGLNQSLG